MWRLPIGILFLSTALYVQTQRTNFSCEGRTSGYYADVGSGCQVYHMCDGLGRQFSYTCPNATLFQQRMLICDHWYMVNCSKSEEDYSANLLIGQKEKHFVEDSETSRFLRTPRPDLLNHPTASEASIIYRTGAQNQQNIVGASNADNSNSEQQPSYFLPSHWSTEYNKTGQAQTQYKPVSNFRTNYNSQNSGSKVRPKAIEINNGLNKLIADSSVKRTTSYRRKDQDLLAGASSFKATTPVYPHTVEAVSEAADDVGLLPPLPYVQEQLTNKLQLNNRQQVPERVVVNFESNFKATTPVYPKTVEATSPNPDDSGLLPPEGLNTNSIVQVNYESNFKATTPVYPKSVEATSPEPSLVGLLAPGATGTTGNRKNPNPVVVNYESNYKATTPVYPKTVEATSPEPNGVGLLAPEQGTIPKLSLDFEAPAVDTKFAQTSHSFDPEKPSKFYQPPRFLPDFTQPDVEHQPLDSLDNSVTPKDVFKHMNSDQWSQLRETFSIPDYDFPLDPVTRPSYDSKFSSFQAKSGKSRK